MLEASAVTLGTEQAEPATRYLSAARERQATAKAAAGKLREVTVQSNSALERWLHLFDRSTAVTAGQAPIYRCLLPPGAQISVAFVGGRTFAQGLVVAISSDAINWADPGADEGLFYYVLPFVRGESLRDKLKREKQLDIAEALAITTQVATDVDTRFTSPSENGGAPGGTSSSACISEAAAIPRAR